MLEISRFNTQTNYKSLQRKNITFKNTANMQQNTVAASTIATPVAPASTLKNLINIVPNSYLDEIGGAALAVGIGVLSRGRIKKANQVINELTTNNNTLTKSMSEVKEQVTNLVKKPVGMVQADVEKLIDKKSETMVKQNDFEQRIADTANGLKREIGAEIDGVRQGQKAINTLSAFPQQTVKVNDMQLNLATIMHPINEGTETYTKFVNELHAQSAKSILGLRKFSKPTTDTSFIRMVAVELKPFTSVGGLSSIPKEMAEELPKIINQTKGGARFILDTPMYTGRVASDKGADAVFSVVKSADSKGFKYQKVVNGQIKESYPLQLIDEFNVHLVGEPDQKVRLFQTQVLAKQIPFADETKKLFKPELLQEVETNLSKNGIFETDNYKITRKDGKDFFQTKLTYNLWDNEKFTMDIPLDKAPGIYSKDALHSDLLGREIYFNKYIYEHTIKMMESNETGQCMLNGKPVLGADAFVLNDWHTGPLAAMIRLGTVGKKYQQGLRADVADKVTDMPIISLLHNTYDGTDWQQPQIEKMLNIMFDENAAKIVPHAYMPNTSISGKGGLPMNLGNACLGSESGRNLSCLNMLAQFSDSIHPVSDGYAKECTFIEKFGDEKNVLRPIFKFRTKEGLKPDDIKFIAKNNGIDVSEFSDKQILQSTFYGIDNGLNKTNNILTDKLITEVYNESKQITPIQKYHDGLLTSSPQEALNWKQANKKAVISFYVDAINAAKGTEKSGGMNAWLGDMTDLTGVTENTPIFATAGRITTQKGYETYMGAIKKYIMSLPKDNNADYPVFITQGAISKDDQYAMDVVNLIRNTKKELTEAGYKKAADRLVLTDRGDGGKFTVTKLVTDFPVMASNYEPCGLTHKEFMNMTGGITVGNKTGGIPSGLPDSTIIKVPFDATSSQEDKCNNFAKGIQEAIALYKDKTKFAKGIQDSLKLDFTWAKEGNSGSKYIWALGSKGAIKDFVA